MKLKSWLLEAARWIMAAAAVIYLLFLLGGDPVSQADFTAVADAVVETVDATHMVKAENQMIKRLYGLAPGAYEGCLLYYPATNMDAEELMLVKLADASQAEAVLAAMENRLQTQKNTFEGYGVEQFDLLSNHCVLEEKGNFVLFVVSKNSADAQKAFHDGL